MDLFVLLNEASIKRCVELLRRVQPDVVITHSPEDYMLDHEQCSVIVRTATFGAPIRNLSTDAADPAPTLPKLPHLYYADPMEGMDKFGERIEPQFGIDITDVIELKERMLASHASQREWLLKHHGIDEYLLSMRHWGRVRGEEFGADYAEAFRQHLGHAYPHDNVIGDVLGSLTR